MSKRTTLFLVLAALFMAPSLFFAQHEMLVDDYTTSGAYLNDVIAGDTTSAGTRADMDRVYVLKNAGVYLVNVQIRNTGWVLRVKSENNEGVKPTIYCYKNDQTSTYPSQIFDAQGDLYISGVNLVGWAEFLPEDISLMPPRIINVSTVGPSIYVDNCVISASRAATIQTSSAASVLRFTNTIFAQGGNLYNTNIGNGRHFDLRNVSADSIIVTGCTMTDNTDRIIRHYSSIASIQHFVFDHNTVVNDLSMHGCIGLGYVGYDVKITNNVFVDNFVLGNDSTDGVRLPEFQDPGELNPNGSYRMTFIGAVPNDTTQWTVSNNYYSVTPAVQAFYDAHSSLGIGNLIPLTWNINKKIADSTKAFTKETITFAKPTHDLSAFATWYFDPNGANKAKVNTGFSDAVDFARPAVAFYSDKSQFDLQYQQTAAAFKGDENGKPAGDPRWFVGIVGVDKTDALPTGFSLEQNYPNPFNPTTKIVYNVPSQSKVKLDVYNILGQHVATLFNGVQAAGQYTVNFDASKLSSGVYVYQLSTNNQLLTKKMMLLK